MSITPISRQKSYTELVTERGQSGARDDIEVYWTTDVDTLLDNQRTSLRTETANISGGLSTRIDNNRIEVVNVSGGLSSYIQAVSGSLYDQTMSGDIDLENAISQLRSETVAVSAGLNTQIVGCVHKTGTEAVSGVKSFYDYVNIISTTSTTAVSGSVTMAKPVGYFQVQVNGTIVKVPYFSI